MLNDWITSPKLTNQKTSDSSEETLNMENPALDSIDFRFTSKQRSDYEMCLFNFTEMSRQAQQSASTTYI